MTGLTDYPKEPTALQYKFKIFQTPVYIVAYTFILNQQQVVDFCSVNNIEY